MKNKNLTQRDFLRKHRFIIPILFIIPIVIIVIVFFAFFSPTNDSTLVSGGEASEEVDPLSGQTIYKINQENENPEGTSYIELVGFDIYITTGFTYTQYDFLTTNISTFFNEKGITRVSIIKDSMEYTDNDSIRYTKVITNTNQTYTLKTDTKESILELSFEIIDQNNTTVYKK